MITQSSISRWENGTEFPDKRFWRLLDKQLCLKPGSIAAAIDQDAAETSGALHTRNELAQLKREIDRLRRSPDLSKVSMKQLAREMAKRGE